MRLGIPVARYGLYVVSTNMRHADPLYLPSVRNERGDSPRRPRREVQLPTSNLRPSSYLHATDCDFLRSLL